MISYISYISYHPPMPRNVILKLKFNSISMESESGIGIFVFIPFTLMLWGVKICIIIPALTGLVFCN